MYAIGPYYNRINVLKLNTDGMEACTYVFMNVNIHSNNSIFDWETGILS
jgi:hypothetical protein